MKKISSNKKDLTLAVLPFENLTQGGEADILCKSFSIDLITELSRFRQFQIISFDSVRDLQLNAAEEREFLEDLHTDYFVRGSFRTDKQCIRINVQLVSSGTHRLVWADRFENDSEHLMELQEKLLYKVVASLQKQVNADLISHIRKKQKPNLKAYECWLYGMEELQKGTLETDLKAREYFEQAIKIDPGYSLAYTGMSLSYFNEWSCRLWERWEVSQNGAYEWAQKAIQIDEQNYVASYVLGRVFLYEGAYETAEHYLRKSLRLNSNDPRSLIHIAICFNYLGYREEAFKLYEKALRLNPAESETYYPVGAVILYELGKMEEAIALANRSDQIPFVDFQAFYAAAWYELGEFDKMNKCLLKFLKSYSNVVNNGEEATLQEAIEWMSKINPYKDETRLEKFWDYISNGKFELKKYREAAVYANFENSMREGGDFWEFAFGGKKVRLATVKGFADLKLLIAQAGTPIHCTELMGIPVLSNGEAVIDEQAKAEYREKITSLQKEIEVAENHRDFEKAGALQEEYEELIEHLSNSLALNGKPRKTADSVEKARSAVTWRIRSAISKIEQEHPALGKHLSNSVHTGTFCSYEPERETQWNLRF